MKLSPRLFLFLALAMAACGGKKGSTRPAETLAPGDDPATPFDDNTVKAALAATPGVAECGLDGSTTLGAHLEAQREVLKGGDADVGIAESITCRAQADDKWECQWAITTVHKPRPAEANPCGGEGEGGEEDPCGGEGGAAYIIIATVSSGGQIDTSSIICNAPG